ncbi:MAG TPA: hypothetical protein VJU61_24440 [Polyangiaceae bacterium]|nr:hypothetical protein [Polyangiaceae bacterium]
MFEVLVATELLSCVLLLLAGLQTLNELPERPEVALAERAWMAARFNMTQAAALGPLFKHLVRASRHGLRLAHDMQEGIRIARTRTRPSGALAPLLALWRRRQLQKSAELADLAHLVEQMEQMGWILAHYRAGAGGLMELRLPLSCLVAETRARQTAATSSTDAAPSAC